jgi:hypothetical protein
MHTYVILCVFAENGHVEPCSSEILEDSLNLLSWTSPNVLCLGLGSPSTSRESRNQLAFLLAITERFHIVRRLPALGRHCIAEDLRSAIKEHARVSIYDPVFTDEDVALLTELKLCRLTENKASPARPGLDHLIYPHGESGFSSTACTLSMLRPYCSCHIARRSYTRVS